MPDGFLNTARSILTDAPRPVTRAELQILAGMPYGRALDQAELRVTEAWVAYRNATRKWRSGEADRFFDRSPEVTRAYVRLTIAQLRALKGKIIAEYGRHLPAIRRGVALDRRV